VFDTSWVAELDAEQACAAITATQDVLREAEWQELVLAGHWAVLHDALSIRRAGRRGPDGPDAPGGPGGERAVHPGGAGTPEIAEFACAELGLVMGIGFIAASTLIRDALDLQHRHPRMWQALGEGKARVWKARHVARLVHAADLTREQAQFVDAATTPYVDTLTWAAFTRLVDARIIEADPKAAEARRLTAELARFVSTGRSSEHGLKTLIARANAGEIVYFVAMCDRIAQILAIEGDCDSIDVRRSKALAILANPARALALLAKHATRDPHPEDPDRTPLADTDPADTDPADTDLQDSDVDPVDTDLQDSDADLHDSDADQQDSAAGRAPGTHGPLGSPVLDPEKLRPRAVLYVRITEQALDTGAGVAHCENGIGPVTVAQLRNLLGHYHVTVRPVLDLAGQVPVDAYEVPHRMREALRLARPSSIFPYSRTATSTPDLDHTHPYQPMARGGPPGQTRPGNLGPMIRFGHRVKTHGRGWQMTQPVPGTYLWRTPHGYWYRVDADGTHALGRDPDRTGPTENTDTSQRFEDWEHSNHQSRAPRTPFEQALADLINHN